MIIVKMLSRVQLFGTPWTIAHQAPPSIGLSRQEYWSGLPTEVDNSKASTKELLELISKLSRSQDTKIHCISKC